MTTASVATVADGGVAPAALTISTASMTVTRGGTAPIGTTLDLQGITTTTCPMPRKAGPHPTTTIGAPSPEKTLTGAAVAGVAGPVEAAVSARVDSLPEDVAGAAFRLSRAADEAATASRVARGKQTASVAGIVAQSAPEGADKCPVPTRESHLATARLGGPPSPVTVDAQFILRAGVAPDSTAAPWFEPLGLAVISAAACEPEVTGKAAARRQDGR